MSPIQRLIKLNPVPCVLETRPVVKYDPSAPGDRPQVPESLWPVVGAMSGVKLEGESFDATFTIDAPDKPVDLKISVSRAQFGNAEYGIKAIRPRYRFGKISGYTLGLSV